MPQDAALLNILERARKDLLDLTARNRLLNTPRSRTQSSRLEIVGESSIDVFQQLVVGRKSMTFQSATEDDDADESTSEQSLTLFQPEEGDVDAEIVGAYGDSVLQTALSSNRLQKKLLKLFYDARTSEEEQGVNILYLALGFLKWYEDDNSEVARFAPLLLIPVRLDRQSASARFRLRHSEEEITTNLSLQARLKNDFGINLPEVPETDELSPEAYFRAVTTAVQTKTRWQVLPNDVVLWFFSFSKFLMYRDLKPDVWPEGGKIETRKIIRSLLQTGFGNDPPLCDDERDVDQLIHPLDTLHVVDADSSQTVVIEEAKRGRNLVIQGPPGTGKSQTIANLISGAVSAGKTVLFVAEKMAALEVVYSRLQRVGLGDMCLELHSSKAKKRIVLDELSQTLNLGAPRVGEVRQLCTDLQDCRDRLNEYLRTIHAPFAPSGITPYQILGELVRLRAQGISPPSFQFAESLKWSRVDFQSRLSALRDLVDHVSKIGLPQNHPWRGVGLDAVLPTDVDRIQAKLPELMARLERLQRYGNELAAQLTVPEPKHALGISSVARLANRLAAAPPSDRRSLTSEVWSQNREQIDQIVANGRRLTECRTQLTGVVCDAGWEAEVGATRRDLAAYGRSWFRFLIPAYRKAQANLRGLLVNPPPAALDARLAILDALVSKQKAERALAEDETVALGCNAFGTLWNGVNSDWAKLGAVVDWEKSCREAKLDYDFRRIYASLEVVPDLQITLKRLSADFKPTLDELKQLSDSLKLDLKQAFGTADLHAIPFAEWHARLGRWKEQPEALSLWITYFGRLQRLGREGFDPIVRKIHVGELSAGDAVATAEMAHYETLLRQVWTTTPQLASFHGASHEQVLQRFRQLDAARIEMARREVAKAHFDRIPRGATDIGAVGLIRHEIEKKRRHLPIRQLLAKAGPAVQAIKPVFLMSPISVAQYLEPGNINFDILVIDEASQVLPVDALGAAARADQIVVVGDSKQLPPSRFFSRMLGEEDAEETTAEELSAGDMESILGLCCAQGVPQRMLRWHYRSRHHSLIAVSNREFYENRLFVFPSPGESSDGQGLSFRYVEGGVFDRGGSATNRVEAKAVAEAVMEHARHRADQSLGVGCFSVAQRDAVLDELEILRREDPSLEQFFLQSDEPFFVKNLENIQGDERDVIFISVGYAKDDAGYMAMSFGPLATDGGERRLNVLITRARDCCRVFCSIRADDIDLNRARSRGAASLKAFLKYAETGLLDTGVATQKGHDSEFERQVASALQKNGFTIEPQVGVAGFFIDLAVVDPEQPGRFLLGIECDGANYHRSRSARDRDRLRSAVLESRGWVIHRIWSTDWFQRPEEELRKTLAAVESARAEWTRRRMTTERPAAPLASRDVELARDTVDAIHVAATVQPTTQPYTVASFQVHTTSDIHEVPTGELARIVARIVEVEGPIHEEELARRITQLWGAQRAGSRIRRSVSEAVDSATRMGKLAVDGVFIDILNRVEIAIRDRSDVPVATVRSPEMLPPLELRKAVTAIVQAHVGVTADEVVTETARLLGFRLTSKPFRMLIEREIAALQTAGVIEERVGNLFGAASDSERMPQAAPK